MKLLIVCIIGLWCNFCTSAPLSQNTPSANEKPTAEQRPLSRGDNAPNFSLPLLRSGQTITLDAYKGKVVYVDFWASWCMPCRRSFPFLNSLRKKYSEDQFQIIAINLEQETAPALQFLATYPANYPVAVGFNSQVSKDYNVAAMPTAYLIGKDGTIRSKHLGFKDSHEDYLVAVIDKLISEF